MIYQVSVGPTSRLYSACQKTVCNYAKKVGADHIIQKEPILRIKPDPKRSGRSKEATEKHGGFLPIFEKENAFDYFATQAVHDYLPTYDRIAIIDSDIWIMPDAPNLFDQLGDADFAGVRERDMPSTERHKKKLRTYSRMQFSGLPDVDWDWQEKAADFHNMGLMLMGNNFKSYLKGQSAQEFLARPEFQRFVNGEGPWKWSTDQVLLNWWIRKSGMKIKNLSWRWNALYGACVPRREALAHAIHFFLRDKLPDRGENAEAIVAELMKP